jgi:hypothetical protein
LANIESKISLKETLKYATWVSQFGTLQTLTLPKEGEHWSLTTVREMSAKKS